MKKPVCAAVLALMGAGFALHAVAHDGHMHGEGMHGGGMHGGGMPPMFEKFDANHDGKLSKDEVHNGVDKMFAEIDTDKDGNLSKDEMQAHHKKMREQMQSRMQERWKAADKDGDGSLSRAEVDAAGMKMLSRDFDKLDKNKDGKLAPDEIRDGMMMRHQGGAGMPGNAK